MAGFWEKDAVVGPQAGGPVPVFTAPGDPREAAADQRDETRTGIAVRSEERTATQDEFGNLDTLRQRYDAQPAVKEYRAVLPLLMAGLQSQPDATGDNSLLYAYAKVMDPGSVVREAESEMAASGAGVWDSTVASLKKEFGVEGGGALPENIRERLKRDMNTKVAEMGRSYLLQRQRFGEEAQATGLDPVRIVGPHDSEPFRERYYQVMDTAGIDVRRPGESEGQSAGGAWGPEQSTAYWGDEVFDAQGNPLGPDGGMAFDAQGNELGLRFRVTDETPAPNADAGRVTGNDPAYQQFAAGVGDIAQAAGDLVGLAGNPLNQTINWLTGANLSTDLGETLRTDVLGLPHGNQTIETINRAVTGGMVPAAGAARLAASFGPGVARASLAEMGASPMRDAAAGAGAGMAGEAARAMGGGPVAQTAAMLAGGGAGALAGGRIAPAVMDAPVAAPRTAAPAGATPAERYAAGQRFGLDMSVGDARPMGSRVLERSLDAQPASAGVMDASRQRLAGQIETAVDDVANSFGPATSFRAMGEAAQTGARRWMDKFSEVTGKLYNAIPIAPRVAADLSNTRAALARMTDVFRSNSEMRDLLQNKRFVAYLEALTPPDAEAAITDAAPELEGVLRTVGRDVAPEPGSLSWEDLKHFRSIVGEQMGEALLTDGSSKSQLRGLYGALSQDMEATARAQGPEALRAFRRANDTFASGQTRIEGAIKSLIGNDSEGAPEKAAAFLQRLTVEGKGSADLKALAEVRKTLRPEEWSHLSNAFIRLIGQPANSAGREFNPGTFVRVYGDMAPEAKNLLFGGQNKELRQNLDDFAKVIEGLADNDATRNVSRTAFGLGGTMSTGLGAAAGASVGGLPGALLGIALTNGAQYGAAKLWTNPGFVRWATGYTKMLKGAVTNGGAVNPRAHESQMKALGRLGASNAIIAGEARDLQQQLLAQFQTGTRPLAAHEEAQTEDRQRTAGETR